MTTSFALRPAMTNIAKPALIGALIGGVSGSPNLGVLSASATVGLGLLDPTHARRKELQVLQDQYVTLQEFVTEQLDGIHTDLVGFRETLYPRGRVAVFVDGSNIYHSLVKKPGQKINYDKLFNKLKQGASELTQIMFFQGVDKASPGMENFLSYLKSLNHPIEIITKPVAYDEHNQPREKGIDTEIALRMVESIGKFDTAILVSGDGDFTNAVERVQKEGGQVEVVSVPGCTSWALRNMADRFIDIGEFDILT